MKRFLFFLAWLVILLAIVMALNMTVFEDGSIQFFNLAGFGLCAMPSMGCSPDLVPWVHVYKDGTIIVSWCSARHCTYVLEYK